MLSTRGPKEHPMNAALRLQQDQAARVGDIAQKTVRVALQPPRPDALSSAAALTAAALNRTVALQTSCLEDWAKWAEFAQSIQGADTTAKYADRVGNIALQAEALATRQIAQGFELLDNIGVSYAYWLTQQLGGEGQ